MIEADPVSFPAIYVYSFGYKHTGIPAPLVGSHLDGRGGGFVFDCRALPNPFWEEALRPYTGLDAPIKEFMLAEPLVGEFLAHASALVLAAAARYQKQHKPMLRVAFGCTGGRHRSVWQAEQLRVLLRREGYRVQLDHLDIERPLQQPRADLGPTPASPPASGGLR